MLRRILHSALGPERALSTRARIAEHLQSKVGRVKAAVSAFRARRAAWGEEKVSASRFRQAAEHVARASRERMHRALGFRRVSPQECADACGALLRGTLRTPFTTYHRAGLYTLECEAPAGNPDARVLVLVHGYGTGSGLWCFLVDQLTPYFKVYAIDWLGCGASERPPWRARTTAEAEAFFIDSLDAWVAATPATADAPFALVGHSLGGYLAAAYALRSPARVAALALLSPAGISAAEAATGSQQQQFSDRQRRHWAVRALARAWEAGVTPQAVVRAMGRWGEAWASRALSGRFMAAVQSHGSQAPQRALADGGSGSSSGEAVPDAADDPAVGKALSRYIYAITAAPGSGEYALRRLLVFGGAHAHDPVGPRYLAAAAAAAAAGAGGSPAAVPPLTILFGGSHDWMPAGPGAALVSQLRALGVDAVAGTVPHSGHHLHMENPGDVARVLQARLALPPPHVRRT